MHVHLKLWRQRTCNIIYMQKYNGDIKTIAFYDIWASTHEISVLIALATSEGSGEPAHLHSFSRACTASMLKI